MPKISDFQPKKSSTKGEWDLSSFISSPKATRPQRRPGRGDEVPPQQPVQSKLKMSEPSADKTAATSRSPKEATQSSEELATEPATSFPSSSSYVFEDLKTTTG